MGMLILVFRLNTALGFLVQQVRQQMEEQVAQKSTELEQYLQRVQELEDMYRRLEDALEDERSARQDEEAVRKLQARSVNEWRRKKCFTYFQCSIYCIYTSLYYWSVTVQTPPVF